jgi:hypothetical protein
MNKQIVQKRVLESLAMLTIGDGLLAALQPRRHVLLWESGPRVWRNSMRPFIRNPGLTRLLGLAAVGWALWLSNRQQTDVR